MKKVATVILNYNGKKFLEQFLPSVIKYNPDYSDIIVADNCSTDDSIDFLKTTFPEVNIIQLKKNLGFAAGYNNALANLEYEYFALINTDVKVTEAWLNTLTHFMDANPKVGACHPKILDIYNKKKFEYSGAGGGYIDYLGYPFCRGRIFEQIETDNNQYNNSVEVFWATGTCFMIRSSIYKELEGFDIDFWAHQEEIDLCWRIKNQGHKIMYVPNSTIYHVGGGTLNSSNPKKTYLNFRNSLLSIIKNVPKKYLISSFLLRLFFDGMAGIKLLTELKPSHTLAIVRAHFSVYYNFFKFVKKRKNIPQELPSCFYKKSIIIEYFLKGKKKFSDLDLSHFTTLP